MVGIDLCKGIQPMKHLLKILEESIMNLYPRSSEKYLSPLTIFLIILNYCKRANHRRTMHDNSDVSERSES